MVFRLGDVRELMGEEGIVALLVSRPSNIFYITGFSGGARLIVPLEGEPILLVGGVDLTAAEEHFPGREVKVELVGFGEKVDDKILDLLGSLGLEGKIGFDELPISSYLRFSRELGEDRLVDVGQKIWGLREIKDEEEIRRIREACRIAIRGMEKAAELIQPGISELEVAGEVERAMRVAGSEAHPFGVIIASGKNSALPHARCSRKCLEEGDLVVVDLGATYGGYVSDMTRTFVVGDPRPWQKEIHELVLRAQEEAKKALRAGVSAEEVDRVARELIKERGYGDYFVHSLGHGLGIEVHEPPRLAPGVEKILRAGHVITVEPGIYLPGRGGVRIEDTVLVLEDGFEVLTEFSYGLRP